MDFSIHLYNLNTLNYFDSPLAQYRLTIAFAEIESVFQNYTFFFAQLSFSHLLPISYRHWYVECCYAHPLVSSVDAKPIDLFECYQRNHLDMINNQYSIFGSIPAVMHFIHMYFKDHFQFYSVILVIFGFQ